MSAEVLAAQIALYAKELKMPGLAAAFEEITRDAATAGRSQLEALAACLAPRSLACRAPSGKPSAGRPLPGRRRALRASTSPCSRASRRLACWALGRAEFIAAKENVVCLGGSGTGKTHIATAIGLAAIYAGARVRFIGAISLAQELLAAADEHRLPRYLKSWQRADRQSSDELGYLPLGPGAPLLFQFLRRALRERLACW